MFSGFPVILQEESFECGLSCLAAIAQSHGATVTLAQLRRRYDITSSGLTLYHLIKVADELGMVARGVRLSHTELDELRLPAVLTWSNHHFVVLTKVKHDSIEIMDPAVGIRRFSRSELPSYFSGTALEITSVHISKISNDTEKLTEERQTAQHPFEFNFRRFLRTFVEYKAYLFPLLIFGIIIQLAAVVGPKFISLTLDEVLAKNDEEFLYLLIYIYAFVYLVQSISAYLRNSVLLRFRANLSVGFGSQVIHALMDMPLQYFNKRSSANILRRVRAVDSVHVIYTEGYLDIGINILAMVIFSIFMFAIDEKLAMLIILSGMFFLLLRLLMTERIKSLVFLVFDWEVKRDYQLLETLQSIIPLRQRQLEYVKASNWTNENIQFQENRVSLERIRMNFEVLSMVMNSFQTLGVVFLGALGILNGETTIGGLVAFIFYKTQFMENANNIVSYHIKLQMAQTETQRLKDFTRENEKAEDQQLTVNSLGERFEAQLTQPLVWHRSDLQKISFGYTNLDKPVLQDVDFYIEYPEKVYLRGPSGAGKSTLMNVISGLLKPSAGKVLINDISLDRLDSRAVKDIAISSSMDVIIGGSVIDNIVFGDLEMDVERLEFAIQAAGMEKMITQLLHGLNTRLGSSGADLSSGQKQRLFLARALYHSPRLLILDEPTSHLDPEIAKEVIDSIAKLPMALLIITHDPALVQICSRGYRMENGKLWPAS